MTSTLTDGLRPRMINIHKTAEAGEMAALEMDLLEEEVTLSPSP